MAYAEETCRLQLREQPRSWRVVPHRVPIFIGCARDAHNRNRRTLRAPERRLDVNAKAAAPSATGTRDTVLQHSPHGRANCEFQHEKRLRRAYAADARRKTRMPTIGPAHSRERRTPGDTREPAAPSMVELSFE